MGNKINSAMDGTYDRGIESGTTASTTTPFYTLFLGIITQKTSALLLPIDSCLQKATLHHATLFSIDAFMHGMKECQQC